MGNRELWKILRREGTGNRIMNHWNLKERTGRFALDMIKLVESLPDDPTSKILGRQLLRTGTSVGANCRAACRGGSAADFISKMGLVETEAAESCYWIELFLAAGKLQRSNASALLKEADELTAIAVASINTARTSAGRRTRMKPQGLG